MISIRAKNAVPYKAGEQLFGNYIRMNTNENPYPPSERVAAALKGFNYETLRLYPDPEAKELRKAIAETEGVEPENVFLGNGSDEVLYLAFAALFDSGIAFPDVTYSFYPVFSESLAISFNRVPTDGGFNINPGDYTGKGYGGIAVANPNAPTALELDGAQIEKIVKGAGCNVIIDEAYIDFADKAVTSVPLIKKYDNILVAKTFSKSRSLAGLRCGYAVGNGEHINALRAMRDSFNSYTLDRAAQSAALEAVKDKEYFEKAVSMIKNTRNRAYSEIRKTGLNVLESGANFLFVELKERAEAFYNYCKENYLLIRYFKKPRIGGFVRVSIGTDDETDVFLRLLKNFLKRK